MKELRVGDVLICKYSGDKIVIARLYEYDDHIDAGCINRTLDQSGYIRFCKKEYKIKSKNDQTS
jgi:hypothetical protein